MVSLKLQPIKSSIAPFKSIVNSRSKNSVRKQFSHVKCSDNELARYFENERAAQVAMSEISKRSWEYQYEFAVEMSKRCREVSGKDPDMLEALDVFEDWYRHLTSLELMTGLRRISVRQVDNSRFFVTHSSLRIYILALKSSSYPEKRCSSLCPIPSQCRTRNHSTAF